MEEKNRIDANVQHEPDLDYEIEQFIEDMLKHGKTKIDQTLTVKLEVKDQEAEYDDPAKHTETVKVTISVNIEGVSDTLLQMIHTKEAEEG